MIGRSDRRDLGGWPWVYSKRNRGSLSIYHRLFKSIEGSVTCEIGGLDQLELSTQEIKEMIQSYVDQHPICLIK